MCFKHIVYSLKYSKSIKMFDIFFELTFLKFIKKFIEVYGNNLKIMLKNA